MAHSFGRITSTKYLQTTPQLVFDGLTGDCSLVKLTHKTGHSLRALCIFLIPETDILRRLAREACTGLWLCFVCGHNTEQALELAFYLLPPEVRKSLAEGA